MQHDKFPNVSVIIPVYNAEATVQDTIASVLLQTLNVHEIILVNDGSTDRSLEKAEDIFRIATNKGFAGDVKFSIVEQRNAGPSAARNKGIAVAEGEYLAFLDSDDIWLPHKNQIQVKRALFQRDYDMFHTSRIRIDLNGMFLSADSIIVEEGEIFDHLFQHNYICCSTVMIKKDILDRIGGFDIDPRVKRSEDYDLWLRVARHAKIGFINIPLVLYRLNPKGHNRENITNTYSALEFVVRRHSNYICENRMLLEKERLSNMILQKHLSYMDANDYGRAVGCVFRGITNEISLLTRVTRHYQKKIARIFRRVSGIC